MAFALLIAFLIPSAGFYVEIIRVSADARNRIEAGNLAAQQIELARATAFSTLAGEVGTTGAGCQPNVSECWTDQQAGITYRIAQSLTWVNESDEADACGGLGDGSSGVQPLLAVTDKVTWLDMPPTMPVEAQTDIFTPPGDYPESTGNLGVSVVDSYGAPVVDALVTMTNADTPHNSITVPTGQTGCAFVAYLPTGNYSVSAELTGYVDQWENLTASESAVALGAGDTVGVTLDYAPADVVDVTWPSGVTLPAVGYYPVTVVNPGLSEPGTGSVALPNGAAPAPLQLQLWPYSNGYEIYPGGCTDSDPGLYGIAETSFAVSQGSTTWLPGPAPALPVAHQRAGCRRAGHRPPSDRHRPHARLRRQHVPVRQSRRRQHHDRSAAGHVQHHCQGKGER